MPPSGGTVTPVAPGLVARLSGAVKYLVRGGDTAWFGPGQPMQPVAQNQGVHGRRFDYPFAVNTQTRIKDEGVPFWQLRALAQNYGLLRTVIETRKDQCRKLKWKVRPRDLDKDPDARCGAAMEFLAQPDRENDWDTWLTMVLEDMFVLDAATVYPRLTRGGGLYALEPVDGATIRRVLDETGRTPMTPDPAYQQVLKGMAAVDYAADELIYRPRNPRTHAVYGFSPVEQIITTINIALRREANQLSYYVDGNLPDQLLSVPDDWQPEQIADFQKWFDSVLAGQSKKTAKFVPGGVTAINTKPEGLKDEMDEWLARLVAFAFSVPPTAFTRQSNRATAETAHQQSIEEGLEPVKLWVKGLMDRIVRTWWGVDLEFAWDEEESIDPLIAAQIDAIWLAAKVVTPDEVRERLGMDPLTAAQKEELTPPVDPQLEADAQQGGAESVRSAPAAKLVKKKSRMYSPRGIAARTSRKPR